MYKGIFIYILILLCCFTSFSLFPVFVHYKMHIFHSFFYRLAPTLLCVDRCLSGLKIAYDIMGEMRAKIEFTEA